jgi:hypothetical protein
MATGAPESLDYPVHEPLHPARQLCHLVEKRDRGRTTERSCRVVHDLITRQCAEGNWGMVKGESVREPGEGGRLRPRARRDHHVDIGLTDDRLEPVKDRVAKVVGVIDEEHAPARHRDEVGARMDANHADTAGPVVSREIVQHGGFSRSARSRDRCEQRGSRQVGDFCQQRSRGARMQD